MRIFSLMAVCALHWIVVSGQNYTVRMQHISVRKGLSDNSVHTVAYDPNGYLWIGTEDGLNRYDGFNFIEFNTRNSALRSDFIEGLEILENGTLVVVTHIENMPGTIEGIYTMGPDLILEYHDNFKQGYHNIDPNRYYCFKENTLYILASEHEIRKYHIPNGSWETQALPTGFNAAYIAHGYVVGTFENTERMICLGQDTTWISEKELQEEDPVMSLMWRLRAQISRYAPIHPIHYATYDRVNDLIWVRSREALTALDMNGNLVRFGNSASSIAMPRNLENVCVGPRGTVYLATYNGLYLVRLQPQLFRLFSFSRDPQESPVQFMQSTRGIAKHEGMLYVAQDNFLYRQDLKGNDSPKLLLDRPHTRYFPVLIIGDTLLTARNSLHFLDLRTEESRILLETISPDIGPEWALYKRTNTLFIGGQNGVLAYNLRKIFRDSLEAVCPFWSSSHVYQFRDIENAGFFYVTTDGLHVSREPSGCDPVLIQFKYPDDTSVPYRRFTSLVDDPDGTFWVTSVDGGLLHFQLKEHVAVVTEEFNREDGVPTNTMYAVYPDDFSGMWISSDLGLIRLNMEDWSYRIYTTEDGLPHDEFNRISHFRDDTGNLYFGGLGGVVALNPADFYSRTAPPFSLRLMKATQFIAWDEKIVDVTSDVAGNGRVVFHPGDKFIRFEVGLEDLFRTEDHRYEYRMHSVYDDWQSIRGNILSINMLPYGSHVLEVRARDADGRYAVNQLRYEIVARRPFYLRLWFLALVTAGFALVIREYWISKTRRVRQRALQLEEVVKDRTATITEQADALKQLQQTRSRFFANISHELRTPLTLIRGPVQSLLERDDHRPEVRDYLQLIGQNAESLGERIDDLLLLSRLDARQLAIHEEVFELNAFLRRVLDGFMSGATEKSIDLSLDKISETDLYIRTDRKKLEHIVSNYLSNAIKFTQSSGNVRVVSSQEDSVLRISVEDSGPGIDPEDAEKVFDRFYQVSKHQHVASGTGIGLAICKELAETLGGSVWLESTPGKGSAFFVQIPCVQVQPHVEEQEHMTKEVPVAETSDTLLDPVQGNGAHILLVEDNRALREFLCNELAGYHVQCAEHGKRAFEMLNVMRMQAALPDCIISDVMMPEMDGFEMVTQIKQDPNLNHIPVVMLTARAGLDDKLNGLRIGVDDYISKPFDIRELKARIINILNRRRAKHEERTSKDTEAGVDQQWLMDLEQHVLKNLSRTDFTMDSLADTMHISRRQLYRKVKLYTGLAANAYVREVRLFEARKFIEQRAFATVAEVSYAVGFEDPDYFSRIYAERFGYRPSQKL